MLVQILVVVTFQIYLKAAKSFIFPENRPHVLTMSTSTKEPLLVRAYNGEAVERIPVWLMRQAGRYMEDFRKYSEKYSFRERSETPDIAIELSLQPWRRFQVDGVIMFSDILTPLPALGVDFTIIEGKGPKIHHPISTAGDVDKIGKMHDPQLQIPFIEKILKELSVQTPESVALIGFIGAPWTLAAYSVEGGHSKLCKKMKKLCTEDPVLAHRLLQKYTDALCIYASYQIASGAQVLQVFESWAHHLTEQQFITFAKPYADRIALHLKAHHPKIPLVYFANGGSCFLNHQKSMNFEALSIDWRISMSTARSIVGSSKVLAGNIDPTVLYSSKENIEHAVRRCIQEAEGKHVLNLGHGVEKDMSEENVHFLVTTTRQLSSKI
eukprot:gene1951-2085_t